MAVRDPMHFVANSKICSEAGCKAQSVLRALRLSVLFTVLASAPCLAEEASHAGADPVAAVSMDYNTLIPNEVSVVPGTVVCCRRIPSKVEIPVCVSPPVIDKYGQSTATPPGCPGDSGPYN